MNKKGKSFSWLNKLRAGAAAFLFVLTAFGVAQAVSKLKWDAFRADNYRNGRYSKVNCGVPCKDK